MWGPVQVPGSEGHVVWGPVEVPDSHGHVVWGPVEMPTYSSDDSGASYLQRKVDAAREDVVMLSFMEGSEADLPSVGSMLHAEGKCTPCHFELQVGLCWNGYECSFCHLHPNEKRKHPSKAARARAKARMMRAMDQEQQEQQQQPQQPLPLSRRMQRCTSPRRWRPKIGPASGAMPPPPDPDAASEAVISASEVVIDVKYQ